MNSIGSFQHDTIPIQGGSIMLKLPSSMLKEMASRTQNHKVNIAACNIFTQTIRMLTKMNELLDRKTYEEVFLSFLSDIELTTPPTDAFIPADTGEKLFVVNQLAPEYIEITKRIPMNLLEETLSPASALIVLLKNDPTKLSKVHDDLFVFFCMYKYSEQIDLIRLDMFSNYTPMIEYIVENITLNDWKTYLTSKKINTEKYAKLCEDLIFNIDITIVHKFYLNNEDENVRNFDVVNLIMRLATNTVLKSDIYFVLGVYMILSFAMADFKNDNVGDSPCVKYICDVLSKL